MRLGLFTLVVVAITFMVATYVGDEIAKAFFDLSTEIEGIGTRT